MAANAMRVPTAISTAVKTATTVSTVVTAVSSPQLQQQPQQPKHQPLTTQVIMLQQQLKSAAPKLFDRRSSLSSVQLQLSTSSTSSCPAHPASRSKSYVSLNSANHNGGSLRPCLRHKRVLSHSCDDLLTATSSLRTRSALQSSRPISSNASLCSSSNSGKSVKFLLPEKKFAESSEDQQMRRFSMGALVPAPNMSYSTWARSVPYTNKSWQALGPQLLFGQNFDRYLWTSVCCPCYQCQTFQLPYAYNFGHFSSSQFSLTRTKQQQQIMENSSTTKMLHYQSSSTAEQEGLFSACSFNDSSSSFCPDKILARIIVLFQSEEKSLHRSKICTSDFYHFVSPLFRFSDFSFHHIVL